MVIQKKAATSSHYMGPGIFYDTIPRHRLHESGAKAILLAGRGLVAGSPNAFIADFIQTAPRSTIFPKLQDCAHFHYDYVEIGSIHFSLFQNSSRQPENLNSSHYDVLVVCGGKSWALHRNLGHFAQLDHHLHTCIFDRRYSNLPDVESTVVAYKDDIEKLAQLLASYLQRLSGIATDNIINCAPVLNWFEMDNKGHHLVALSECSDLNTPAITAAFATKRYAAKSSEELSFDVGDIISIIDMGARGGMLESQFDHDPSFKIWWKGKRGFNVGYFPSHHVELLNENLLTPDQPNAQRRLNGSDHYHARCSSILDRSTMSLGLLPTNMKWINFLQTFFNSRPSKRKLRARGIYKERVFGCDLGEYLSNINQPIPPILSLCCEWIEKHGIVDGIYRLSGISSNIQKIRNAFDDEKVPELDVIQDIHSISSALKMYFRELPNPLLTFQLYPAFVDAINQSSGDVTDDVIIEKLGDVIHRLPPPHYRTVVHLFRHLSFMARHSENTNMHPKNLAIVWAPNLLRCRDVGTELTADSAATALHGASIQALVTEYLIKYAHQLFFTSNGSSPGQVTMRQPAKRINGHHSTNLRSSPGYGIERDVSLAKQPPLEVPPKRPQSMGIVPIKSLQAYPQIKASQFNNCAQNRPVGTYAGPEASNVDVGCGKALEYMDICGGPSALPLEYHTVIDLPSHNNRTQQQHGRKKKRLALKELQTSLHQCLPQDQAPALNQDINNNNWLPLKPRNQIILSKNSESLSDQRSLPDTQPSVAVSQQGLGSNDDWQCRSMSTSVVKLWDLPLSADTIIDLKFPFESTMPTNQQSENFLKRNVMKHWRNKSDEGDLMVRRFRSNAVAPLISESFIATSLNVSPPRMTSIISKLGKLDGITEVREDSQCSQTSSPRDASINFSFHGRFLKHHKGTNTENLSFPRIGKLVKSPRRASLFPPRNSTTTTAPSHLYNPMNQPKDITNLGIRLMVSVPEGLVPRGSFPREQLPQFGGHCVNTTTFGEVPVAEPTQDPSFNFYENVQKVLRDDVQAPVTFSHELKVENGRTIVVGDAIQGNTALKSEAEMKPEPKGNLVKFMDSSCQTEDNRDSMNVDVPRSLVMGTKARKHPGRDRHRATNLLRRANSDTLFPLNCLPNPSPMELTILPDRDFGRNVFFGQDIETSSLQIPCNEPQFCLRPVSPPDPTNGRVTGTVHLANYNLMDNTSVVSLPIITATAMLRDPGRQDRIEREIKITLQSSPTQDNLESPPYVYPSEMDDLIEEGPPRPPSPVSEGTFDVDIGVNDLPVKHRETQVTSFTGVDAPESHFNEDNDFLSPPAARFIIDAGDSMRKNSINPLEFNRPNYQSGYGTLPSAPQKSGRDKHNVTIANAALDSALSVLHKHRRFSDRQPSPESLHTDSHQTRWAPKPMNVESTPSNSYVNSLPRRRLVARCRPALNDYSGDHPASEVCNSDVQETDGNEERSRQVTQVYGPSPHPPPRNNFPVPHPGENGGNFSQVKHEPKPIVNPRSSPAIVLQHVVRYSGNEVKLHKPAGILKNNTAFNRVQNLGESQRSNNYRIEQSLYPPTPNKPPVKRRVEFAGVNLPERHQLLPLSPNFSNRDDRTTGPCLRNLINLPPSPLYDSDNSTLLRYTSGLKPAPNPFEENTPINVRMLKDRFENRTRESLTLRSEPERCTVRRLISSDSKVVPPVPPIRSYSDLRSSSSLSPLKGTRITSIGTRLV